MSGKTTTRQLPTLEEAEERVRVALDLLARVRVANGQSPSGTNHGYGSLRNRSAYCIGASIGAGASHSSCDSRYHGQRCTCECHQ